MPRSHWKLRLLAGLVPLALLVAGGPAGASPDTLRLGVEDVLLGAADVVAAPVTGGIATAATLDQVSDNAGLQATYAFPGWLGLTLLHTAQGFFRVVVGTGELVAGIFLFPFPDADVPEEWNIFRQGSLVEARNPLAENPEWLPWVLPVTPITMDVRVFPVSPMAEYLVPGDDEFAGDEAAWAAQ